MANKIFKNYKYALLAIFIVGFLAIIFSLGTRLAYPNYNYVFTKDSEVDLFSGSPVYQKFTANQNGLSQINFSLGNQDSLEGEDKILLELRDENCEKTIFQDGISSLAPSAKIYTTFKFPRINDSNGKTYCFWTMFVTEKQNSKDKPSILVSFGDQFSGVSYYSAGKNKTYENRSLIMKPAYKNTSIKADVQQLADRMSQYKPWFFKGIFLEIIIVSFLLLTIALVISLVLL